MGLPSGYLDKGTVVHVSEITGKEWEEVVNIIHSPPDDYFARYWGRWYTIYTNSKRSYIKSKGKRLTVKWGGP